MLTELGYYFPAVSVVWLLVWCFFHNLLLLCSCSIWHKSSSWSLSSLFHLCLIFQVPSSRRNTFSKTIGRLNYCFPNSLFPSFPICTWKRCWCVRRSNRSLLSENRNTEKSNAKVSHFPLLMFLIALLDKLKVSDLQMFY